MKRSKEDNKPVRFLPSLSYLEDKVIEYHQFFHILLQWSDILPKDVIFEIGKHYYNIWSSLGNAHDLFPSLVPRYEEDAINEQYHISLQIELDDSNNHWMINIMRVEFDPYGRYRILHIKEIGLQTGKVTDKELARLIVTDAIGNILYGIPPNAIPCTEIHIFCDENLKEYLRGRGLHKNFNLNFYEMDAHWCINNAVNKDLLFQYDRPTNCYTSHSDLLADSFSSIIATFTCKFALCPYRLCYENKALSSDEFYSFKNYVPALLKCVEKYDERQVRLFEQGRCQRCKENGTKTCGQCSY